MMVHYYAIAERGGGKTWWISFPDGPGIYSAADDAGEIVAQAQDALASMLMDPPSDQLPRSIEDGARPPVDLSDFERPTMVVVIPFEAKAETREAA
jgi:predicted RNase H-like HicB family nuclease